MTKRTTKADLAGKIAVLEAEVEVLRKMLSYDTDLRAEVEALKAEVANSADRVDELPSEIARVVEITIAAVIERLQRDPDMPRRSRLDWELLLAPVCELGRSEQLLSFPCSPARSDA
jgi:hypothetical protein